MESLHIEPAKKSPGVHFEKYSGSLTLTGRSGLENPGKFYEPLLAWVIDYMNTPSESTTFRMHMEYFNSSSSKHMMKMLRVLEAASREGKTKALVEWKCDAEDDSMREAGEDFQSVLKLDFSFIEY